MFILYSGSCCPGSITLEASAAVVNKWPKYFGGYNPTGKRYHGSPVYINQHGLFLFVTSKGAWSANQVVNERGVLRGSGTGTSNCVASVTDWKLWDNHKWRSANITVSCNQGTWGIDSMWPQLNQFFIWLLDTLPPGQHQDEAESVFPTLQLVQIFRSDRISSFYIVGW